MKNIKTLFSIFILFGIIVVACKKSERSLNSDSNKALEKTKFLTAPNGDLIPINPAKPLELQKMELIAGYNFSEIPVPSTESEAATMVMPLMNNSKQFFYDMGLSNQDLLEEFDSLDDYKIAYVAFAMQSIDAQPGGGIPGCDANNKIVRCIVQSLIPCTILDFFNGQARDLLISQGFRAGFNALSYGAKKSVVKILATSAGRMFGGGALSLTLFVYDFGVCLLSGSSGGFNVNDNELSTDAIPNLSPTSLPNQMFYWQTRMDVINSDITAGLDMPFFYNAINGKYYSDNSFLNLVPDGYYYISSIATRTVGNPLAGPYYYITNGTANAEYYLWIKRQN